MNERIRKLRELLKINQEEFAQKLNLKRNSISLIEGGKRNPSDRTITDICTKFNVSEQWLRNGIGEIFIETPSSVMEQIREEFNLDDLEFNIISEYLKLDEDKRQVFRDFAYKIAKMEIVSDLVPTIPDETVENRIDREVANYRAELELEARKKEKSSVSDDTAGNEETA